MSFLPARCELDFTNALQLLILQFLFFLAKIASG